MSWLLQSRGLETNWPVVEGGSTREDELRCVHGAAVDEAGSHPTKLLVEHLWPAVGKTSYLIG